MTLPPLPEPWRKSLDRTKINTTALNPFAGMSQSATPDFYTAAQMIAYATAAVLAEREACAKVCETVVTAAMDRHDEPYKSQLQRIGEAIGYGRAQQLLGELWDATLHADYGVASNRGQMGVTIDDALPPIPKATKLRRESSSHGGYQMVPAYSVAEMKAFAHAALSKQPAGEGEK